MEVVSELNLQRLFEMQAQLDADILDHHPVRDGENRLNKKILALLVELGECANEWRGFKFWSNDQEPRTEVENKCLECKGEGFDSYWTDEGQKYDQCECCCGTGIVGKSNPLLEEYVDCLHFILSVGNDLYFGGFFDWDILESDEINLVEQFKNVFEAILDLSKSEDVYEFVKLFEEFYVLGQLLGFEWKEIERAYIDKNTINHKRQADGY